MAIGGKFVLSAYKIVLFFLKIIQTNLIKF